MRMMTMPVTGLEVRWFFEGNVTQQDELRRWFHAARPWRGTTRPEHARAEPRAESASGADVHLVIPAAADMGIRWRRGTLQVKGRMNGARTERFCGSFEGRLERWVTWSYDDLAAFYRSVFAAPPHGVVTVPVRSTRLLRKVRLDARTGLAEEVPPETFVTRGLTVELADLEVNGMAFCSLGFEAFPDDVRMPATFVREVSACLASLEHVTLSAANSQSYPGWLGTLAGCNARPVAASRRGTRLAMAL
jgi:hypothetical protein